LIKTTEFLRDHLIHYRIVEGKLITITRWRMPASLSSFTPKYPMDKAEEKAYPMQKFSKNLTRYCLCTIAGILVNSVISNGALAKKTAFPVYEDSFDLAAGGASLTRATQEGVLFSNPAQLAYAGTLFRWIGLKTTLYASKSSVDLVKSVAQSASKKSGESDSSSSSGAATDAVDNLSESPIHFGAGFATSFIGGLFGIGIVSRAGPDIEFQQIGSSGLPEFDIAAEVLGASAVSAALKPLPWLSFGATAKMIAASEPELSFDISQQSEVQQIASSGGKSLTSLQMGKGADIGSLMLFRSSYFDYGLAYKIDDVGNTKFTGEGYPKSYPQSQSAGVGITFHNSSDALHLSLDYRDLTNVYELPVYKRVCAGAKLTIPNWIGIAVGVRDGSPTMGAYADLWIFKVGVASYTRELGDAPGVRRRKIYSASISTGMSF
jgi:hypothetical protein